MAGAIMPGRPIHGRFGKVIFNGAEVGECNKYEWTLENEKAEVRTFSNAMVQHKAGMTKGTGTLGGVVVDSNFIATGTKRFSLLLTLEDPEAYGAERVELYNCMFDSVGRSVEAGDVVTGDYPFTFDGYAFRDLIEA